MRENQTLVRLTAGYTGLSRNVWASLAGNMVLFTGNSGADETNSEKENL
jgi:uncharacterized protein CbrC (UPF0167 family)